MAAIRNYLSEQAQVIQLYDLHIWAISTTEVALSVHLIISDDQAMPKNFLTQLQQQLHDEVGIEAFNHSAGE